jgi:simple sugar transport system ATP-binding protein
VATLELHGVDKFFGSVHAVQRASLVVEPGRIHAVVGENGAGKSTLLRIAAGLLVPDEGSVKIDGETLSPHTPAEAIRRGVAMVEQHFALVEVFTGLENILLGVEPTRGAFGSIDVAQARAKGQAIAQELGAVIPFDTRVASLGVGERQRLEIARALYRDAKVIILDEPTAVLTSGEADALYGTLRRLASAGRAVVVVTHKLDEVRDHADIATVVRRGEIIETLPIDRTEASVRTLATAIMGIQSSADLDRRSTVRGASVIVVKDLIVGRGLRGVSFEVRAGEIVGIAGVEGNGQRELVRALSGLEPAHQGTLSPEASALAFVHEDRHQEGLVLDATVRDNVLLGELGRFTTRGVLDLRAMDREAMLRVDRAHAPPDIELPARALSGGNQQKLVVVRAISRLVDGSARGLVVAHPTRGVDIAASRAIHAEILGAAERGAAVLLVSADLRELRALSGRLIVFSRGRISAELPPGVGDAEIGHAMLAGMEGRA